MAGEIYFLIGVTLSSLAGIAIRVPARDAVIAVVRPPNQHLAQPFEHAPRTAGNSAHLPGRSACVELYLAIFWHLCLAESAY